MLSILLRHPWSASVGAILVYSALRYFNKRKRNPKNLPYPPGPKGYSLIKALLSIPAVKPWLVYHQWYQTYGDIVYFEILGQSFLILGTLKRAADVFEKRSFNYSDRMRLPMIAELMGHDCHLPFQPYGARWRKHRRAFHEQFSPQLIERYRPVHVQEVRAFLRRLYDTPQEFTSHIERMFAGSILKIVYGYEVQGDQDPLITITGKVMAGITEAGHPGAFMVDLIPALKYVPAWFPGAGFQKKAARHRLLNIEAVTKPYEGVMEQIRNGTALPSVALELIEALPEVGSPSRLEEEEVVKGTTSVAYLGGADSTHATVKCFFLAMALHQESMKRAQMELDLVLSGRLPEFSDRDHLPYVNALIKEIMRWRSVTNFAFPHMASNDDEYDGFFIPKGTVVIGNTWSMLNDPEVYDRPDEFIPERFLTKDGQLDTSVRDPSVAAFGFGRRICPGRHYSADGLFIMVASTLAVFDILPPLDSAGNVVKPREEFTSEVLSAPLPFECRIIPRSSSARTMIEQGLDQF